MEQRSAALVGGGVAFAALAVVIGVLLAKDPIESVLACPAIGYVPGVTVELGGHSERVDGLRYCADGACSPLTTADGTAASDSDSASSPGPSTLRVRYQDGAWRLSPAEYVTSVTVTAYHGRQALVTTDFPLEWHRAAPGDRCDHSQTTAPVRLEIPAAPAR